MVRPTLSTDSSAPSSISADVLVVGVRPGTDGGPATIARPATTPFSALDDLDLAAIGATGAKDQLVRIPAVGVEAAGIALVGLGSGTDAAAIRSAAGSAVRQLPHVSSIVLALPTDTDALVEAALEGAALGAYAFARHKGSGSTGPVRGDQRVTVLAPSAVADATVRPAIVADAASLVRDLVNTAAGDLGPADVASVALAQAEGLPLTVEVLDEVALEEQGFGGIAGVGRGSVRPPRLVVVRYAPAGAQKHLALVGKGITFDSGGLSLKPAASMLGMKTDMTGAATVLAATVAAARLGLDTKVTAWLCLAENMPSGSATRPGDVLTLKNGKTVEVTNTDAEGRLVLGDGMAAASLEQPDAIVDVATLTGAQVVALGDRTTGLMGSDDLVAQVRAVAESVAEPIWPMPLPEELDARLASEIADMVNATVGNPAGGMLLAGKFLERFVGEGIPWAHLDIAGPSENKGGGYGWLGKGATGVMVRTLISLAEELQAK
ncbi:leucyl aminopeptidase [Curtobacterium flaccumfaciens]|uniref:Probable cytosol aminopeptidase n=1 Tax=Curtobacterium flaccumfaciens TaxID=2035 RepID=A0A4R6DF59_9MICO|nr:leucyl aminopeptidase [Curtobacterium flaccumfaciens]TDN43207.1 leucyl aminopeptidase [Curtobacterium flaccumfaciens]